MSDLSHPSDPPAPTLQPQSNRPKRAPSVSRAAGALFGLLAAAAGLAAGELIANLGDSMLSPVIGVGNRAVDLVPPPVKRFAISTFGTHDKQALLIGIGAAIAVFAVVVGLVARRRPLLGAAGLVGFGALGMVAATTGRSGSARASIPSAVAGIVAVGTLLTLLRASGQSTAVRDGSSWDPSAPSAPTVPPAASSASNDPIWEGIRREIDGMERPLPVEVEVRNIDVDTHDDAHGTHVSRRSLLTAGAVATATLAMAGTARGLQQRSTNRIKRSVQKLPAAMKRLAGVPDSAQVAELADVTPFITPNKDFYRIDTALVVPRVDIGKWTLKVTGKVTRERTYTYEDLLAMPLVEQDITLTCVSNEVGGILMGNARWLGIPLSELLADAGAQDDATQIVGRSVDGFSAGFPVAALKNSKALVAVGMNGEPLPFQHGYPARLVVPGIYGYASATKWLDTIEVTTLEAADGYWVPRGYSKEAPIKMGSRIDVPRGLSTIPAGRSAIAGVAWSQTVGIGNVEVSIDGGPWQAAMLADQVDIDTWRQWKFEWDATTGQHEITVRALDTRGRLQQEKRVAPLPNGATGWHQITVFVA